MDFGYFKRLFRNLAFAGALGYSSLAVAQPPPQDALPDAEIAAQQESLAAAESPKNDALPDAEIAVQQESLEDVVEEDIVEVPFIFQRQAHKYSLVTKIGFSYTDDKWFELIGVQLKIDNFFIEFSYEEGPESKGSDELSLLDFIEIDGTRTRSQYIIASRLGLDMCQLDLIPIKDHYLFNLSVDVSVAGGLFFDFSEFTPEDSNEAIPSNVNIKFYFGVYSSMNLAHDFDWTEIPIIEDLSLGIGVGIGHGSPDTTSNKNFPSFPIYLTITYYE